MAIHSTKTARPWADSPRETAGAEISQAVASRTTDSVRGDVEHVVRLWGSRKECEVCAGMYWSYYGDRQQRDLCVCCEWLENCE